MSERFLPIYLQDHLASAAGGIAFARRIRSQNSGNTFGEAMSRIVSELEEERAVLEEILDALGVSPSRAKIGAAWLVEKAGRLKGNGRLTGYSPLSRLLELEAMAAAVIARSNLWRTLKAAAPTHPQLAFFDLDLYLSRALEQHHRLEALHLEAALLTLEQDRLEALH